MGDLIMNKESQKENADKPYLQSCVPGDRARENCHEIYGLILEVKAYLHNGQKYFDCPDDFSEDLKNSQEDFCKIVLRLDRTENRPVDPDSQNSIL